MGRDQLTQIPDIEILPNISDIPDGTRNRTSTKRKASPGRGHKRTLSVGVTKRSALSLRPAAAPVYAVAAAAKKQLAEALVLHEHGVVAKDDILLVQGVVGKGVGAPVDIAAGATAAAALTAAPVLVAWAPVSVPGAPAVAAPSAADIRKTFLEKVHAAAATTTTTKKEKAEEKKEDDKCEAAGGLLVDVSVPPTASAVIAVPLPSMAPRQPQGCLRRRVRRQRRESPGGMSVYATTTNDTAAPMAIGESHTI
ncbi:hypothetical protein DL771_003132 [Monosporascus sp. 5C6A]|nr:hypothetical protein DL771_003132 [Monosporascus sp. 5C6A]